MYLYGREEDTILRFDGGSGRSKLKGLLQYLKDEWKAKKGGEMDVSEWELVECTDDTPRQLNGESKVLLLFGIVLMMSIISNCLLYAYLNDQSS